MDRIMTPAVLRVVVCWGRLIETIELLSNSHRFT
jgi:hypothetical protein